MFIQRTYPVSVCKSIVPQTNAQAGSLRSKIHTLFATRGALLGTWAVATSVSGHVVRHERFHGVAAVAMFGACFAQPIRLAGLATKVVATHVPSLFKHAGETLGSFFTAARGITTTQQHTHMKKLKHRK